MKSRLSAVLLAIFLVAYSSPSLARTPVVVDHVGKDSVGQRLAYELREVIRGSQSMRLVTAKESDPRIVIHLITIDTLSSSPGNGTSAAMTVAYDSDNLSLRGYLLTTVVQNCGSQKTQECARNLAASIDDELEYVRKDWPSLWKLLK